MRRVHATLESGSKKIQELSTELKATCQQLDSVRRAKDDQATQIERLKQEINNYRSTHQTADDEVIRLRMELQRLTEETKQLNLICRGESSQCLELATELGEQKHQNAQQTDELRRIQIERDTKQYHLEQSEALIRELQTQLKEANEKQCGISQSAIEATQTLRVRTGELQQAEKELKDITTQWKLSESTVEELELQVQQLTRQLEQSESLRGEAQRASNEVTSGAAQIRIELAKKEEQLNIVNGQLEACKQQVATLEKHRSQQEIAMSEQLQERHVRETTVQRLEHELANIKQYCTEIEHELAMSQEKGVALRSDLLQTQTAFEEISSRQHVEDNARARMEFEVKNLRQLNNTLSEQVQHQELLMTKLKQELKVERTRVNELSTMLSDKDEIIDRTKAEAIEVGRVRDDLLSRLNERESALEIMQHDLENNTSRLMKNTQTLTSSETEILEMRRKLELTESKCEKLKEENSQYVNIVTSLEARLLEKDKQLHSTDAVQTSVVAAHERTRTTQLSEVIKDLKQQLSEYKKANTMSKTERAQLQETVNRLQGELTARSEALRQVALETACSRREHQAALDTQTSEWRESVRLVESKWKAECEQRQKLESDLEQSRAAEISATEALNQVEKEQFMLKAMVNNLEERNSKLVREYDAVREDKIRLEEDCILLTKKLDAARAEVREISSVLQSKLDSKVQELEQLIKNHSKREEREKGTQTNHLTDWIGRSDLKDSEPSANIKSQMTTVPKEDPMGHSTNQSQRSEKLWSAPDSNSVESRVHALKLANQRLREDVANACQALRTSCLLPETLRDNPSRSEFGSSHGIRPCSSARRAEVGQHPERKGEYSPIRGSVPWRPFHPANNSTITTTATTTTTTASNISSSGMTNRPDSTGSYEIQLRHGSESTSIRIPRKLQSTPLTRERHVVTSQAAGLHRTSEPDRNKLATENKLCLTKPLRLK